ncbi:hypothetical protein MHU86_18546 [Fragilaria crotonensis]|nr:hypothetical protein MHU86_18546 [Fragilaria crotonensis]
MSEAAGLTLPAPKFAIIRSAFMRLCSDETFRLRVWRKWLPAEIWAAALTLSGLIDESICIVDAKKFNAAMFRSKLHFDGLSMDRFDGTNQSGVFRITFQKTMYYVVTDPFEQVEYPYPLDKKWKDRVVSIAADVLSIGIRTRSTTSSLFSFKDNEVDSATLDKFLSSSSKLTEPQQYTKDASLSTTSPEESTDTRSAVGAAVSSHRSSDQHDWQQEQELQGVPRVLQNNTSTLPFWNSHDAWNLFVGGGHTSFEKFSAANNNDGGESVLDILEHNVIVLQSVSKTPSGWRNVVQGRDNENLCSEADIFVLQSRSIILCLAYRTAIRHMNSWTWKQCCTEACRQLNELGVVQATKPRSVQDWNVEFRKSKAFLHPDHIVRSGRRPIPLLFLKYPDAKDQMTAFGLGNLSILTVELVHVFCIEELFPKLFKQWNNDLGESNSLINSDDQHQPEPLTLEMFLKEHGISNFSIPTCWRWLHQLGFTYNIQRKGYYVDGHERDDVVASRKHFCRRYLTELEPRCLRWVQYASSDLKSSNLNPEFGYKYIDNESNDVFYEFHVDYCYSRRGNENFDAMRGKVASMSVRAPHGSRPIEIYGQDESVFPQFLFPSKSWVGPNQERGLFPKSLGEGLMISAFVSRSTGFGMPMVDRDLAIVNASRQGMHYVDRVAALEVHKHTQKQPLTQSPFVRNLLIGATKGGYWNSFHMAIQLEDVVDCLKLLRPQVDFVFMFDHSQGHARKKEGALDANSMSRSFGGMQPTMHSSEITGNCIGPFQSTLRIGERQSMVFEADDQGPWWLMSTEARERRKYDIHDNSGRTKIVPRTRSELASALLQESGITVESNRPLIELKGLASMHGVSLTRRKVFIIEGWVGKPKGLLQVLWERGWIDMEKCREQEDKEGNNVINTSYYTLSGRKDPVTGKIIESSSLRGLMGNCNDFKTEETALQFLGSQLGVQVMLTPKFHCEFAGEGIEYAWAQAKALMRRTPMREKKGRVNFMNLVTKCLCPVTVLTNDRIRKFAARARAYVCTYYYLEQENSSENVGDIMPEFNPAGKQQLLYKKIEQLMKKFKTHRCALDFDMGFVLASLKADDDDN